MKLRILITFALAILLLSALTGCRMGTVDDRLDAAEDYVEDKLDTLEDNVESALTPSPATNPNRMSAEEAEAIALADAGLTVDRLTRIRTEYDPDDGVPEYDIKFWSDGLEYEYEIHAETGTILRKETEPQEGFRPATEPTVTEPPMTEPPATQTMSPSTERLTAEEAEAIALADAGLTADQVSYLRTEYDLDDGIPEYEVDFYHDGWEYDYKIHAQTGKILSWDKDRDD